MTLKDLLYEEYLRTRAEVDREPAKDDFLDTITRDSADMALDSMWDRLRSIAEQVEGSDLYKVCCYERTGSLHHEELCTSLYKAKEAKRKWIDFLGIKPETKKRWSKLLWLKDPPEDFVYPTIWKMSATKWDKVC